MDALLTLQQVGWHCSPSADADKQSGHHTIQEDSLHAGSSVPVQVDLEVLQTMHQCEIKGWHTGNLYLCRLLRSCLYCSRTLGLAIVMHVLQHIYISVWLNTAADHAAWQPSRQPRATLLPTCSPGRHTYTQGTCTSMLSTRISSECPFAAHLLFAHTDYKHPLVASSPLKADFKHGRVSSEALHGMKCFRAAAVPAECAS